MNDCDEPRGHKGTTTCNCRAGMRDVNEKTRARPPASIGSAVSLVIYDVSLKPPHHFCPPPPLHCVDVYIVV